MNFIVNLKSCSGNSFLKQATQSLKKAGDSVVRKTKNGTEVKYIRGEDINARGFGSKYKLFKEVTKPDGTRYVTNANVIRDDVYINEIYHIEPNYRGFPNYVPWADHKYILDTGFSNKYEVKIPRECNESVTKMGMPEILKDLLRKKVEPRNGYRTRSTNYSSAQNETRASQNTSGKITKDAFIAYMENRLKKNSKNTPAKVKEFKDSEIRNLAKLFGIAEESMRNFSKKVQRELFLKFHPDRNNDKNASKIFQMVGAIAPVK